MEECSPFCLHCLSSFLYPLSVPYKDHKLSLPSWLKDYTIKGPWALRQKQSDEDALQIPLSLSFQLRHLLWGSWCPTLGRVSCLQYYCVSKLLGTKWTEVNTTSHSHEKTQQSWLYHAHNLFPMDITIWQIPGSLLLSYVLRFWTRREKGSATTSLHQTLLCNLVSSASKVTSVRDILVL